MKEKWLPVVGYEELYEVSNFGQVRTISRVVNSWRGLRRIRSRLLTLQTANKFGHLSVGLNRHNGKPKTNAYVHRLVLEAFVGPCPKDHEARHFPVRDPTNNKLWNLQWSTRSENLDDRRYHGTVPKFDRKGEKNSCCKLSDSKVKKIRKKFRNGINRHVLSKEFNVSWTTVDYIVKRKNWKHI